MKIKNPLEVSLLENILDEFKSLFAKSNPSLSDYSLEYLQTKSPFDSRPPAQTTVHFKTPADKGQYEFEAIIDLGLKVRLCHGQQYIGLGHYTSADSHPLNKEFANTLRAAIKSVKKTRKTKTDLENFYDDEQAA